jgi:F-type H+-transporting ATPase subunit a
MHGGLHIALAAERIFTLWGLPVTNTLLAEWGVMVVLITTAILVGRNPTLVPGKVQNFFEIIFEFVLDFMEQTLGSRELAVRFFPLIATIFVFIACSNLFDFIPFFGSIVVHQGDESVPLLRAVNSDLNVTLALAIIAVFSIEISGIVIVGALRYGGKFINFSSPLNFVVGLIELVSELSRFISFSFRLFGNIFAGEVLLAVVGLFVPYVLPVPLMAFETFVGLVQAAVFAMLTLFFIKLAITDPHGAGHQEKSHAPAH